MQAVVLRNHLRAGGSPRAAACTAAALRAAGAGDGQHVAPAEQRRLLRAARPTQPRVCKYARRSRRDGSGAAAWQRQLQRWPRRMWPAVCSLAHVAAMRGDGRRGRARRRATARHSRRRRDAARGSQPRRQADVRRRAVDV